MTDMCLHDLKMVLILYCYSQFTFSDCLISGILTVNTWQVLQRYVDILSPGKMVHLVLYH